MNLPLYLLWRFSFSVVSFLEDWYLDSFKWTSYRVFNLLEGLDKTFALKITLRHFVEPLYGDRNLIGYFMGIVWRSLRVAVALALYLLIVVVCLSVYLVWLALPPYLLFKTLTAWLSAKI